MIDTLPPPRRLFLTSLQDLPREGVSVRTVLGKELGVAFVEGAWIAFENVCPHQGIPLAGGECESGILTCPAHGWRFDLAAGTRVGIPQITLKTYQVILEGEQLYVEFPVVKPREAPPTYLVRYALPGWVARFTAPPEVEVQGLMHRQRVVVQTNRGEEIGEYLGPPPKTDDEVTAAGSILRVLKGEEEQGHAQSASKTGEILRRAQSEGEKRHLPQEFADVEALLSGGTIIYFLGPDGLELADLAEDLHAEFSTPVHFQPLIDLPSGGGCGSGGCGCKS
ncbi:MAG: Rieske (2Fe-2S) protein [Planctomycetales bacterium]